MQPIMVLAGKFAQDMMLFTTQEFDFFSLPENFTTGSSIMPHKANYDIFEIMRGKSMQFGSFVQQLHTLSAGVGCGYHRDLQLTKKVTLEAIDSVESTLEILRTVVPELKAKEPKLSAALTPEMRSVAKIDRLVAQGVPFRDAYLQVKQQLKKKDESR